MDVHIRWMIRRDMPAVLAIDAGLREPWTEDEFLRRLRERNCIGLVAERGDEVVGFAIYRLPPGQPPGGPPRAPPSRRRPEDRREAQGQGGR